MIRLPFKEAPAKSFVAEYFNNSGGDSDEELLAAAAEGERVRQDATPTRYDPALCEPFSRARAEKGDAVCDEAGEPARVLHYSENGVVACLFERLQNLEWRHQRDLRMAPRKTKRWWIVTYVVAGTRRALTELHETEEAARRQAGRTNAVVSFTDIPE